MSEHTKYKQRITILFSFEVAFVSPEHFKHVPSENVLTVIDMIQKHLASSQEYLKQNAQTASTSNVNINSPNMSPVMHSTNIQIHEFQEKWELNILERPKLLYLGELNRSKCHSGLLNLRSAADNYRFFDIENI